MANDPELEKHSRSDSSMSRHSITAATISSLTLSPAAVNPSKPAIVLNLGSRITRCGLAGEFEPRYSCDTRELCPEATKENLIKRDAASLRIVEVLLKKIFFDVLTLDSRGARVLIVESPCCPTALRSNICQTLIEKLDVGQVSFAPSPLLATLPFNVLTAFVVEIGHNETLAMPIDQGVSMMSQCYVNQRTGSAIIEKADELIRKHGGIIEANDHQRPFTEDEWSKYGEKLTKKFVEEYCFCTKRDRAQKIREHGNNSTLEPKTVDAQIRFGPLLVKIPGLVRETVFEVLFDDDDESFSDPSIQKMIFDTILRCPIDIRRKFFDSLLICGGLACTPGFLARLKEEIIALATQKSMVCAEAPKFFYFSEAKVEHILTWIGGSILAACPYGLQIRSISRDDWNKNKRVPDWTDYICGVNNNNI